MFQHPIIKALTRHKTATILIALEIAFCFAILCNAAYLVSLRIERTQRPSGLAESEQVIIRMTGTKPDENAEATRTSDLAALRAIPGVKAATSYNQIPFGGSSWNSGVSITEDQDAPNMNATMYLSDEGFLETFGLRVIEGRSFEPDEFLDFKTINDPTNPNPPPIPSALITKSMADTLFPGESAIGKMTWSWTDQPIRVVGVLEHLIRPNNQGGEAGREFSMVLPVKPAFGAYMIRTTADQRTRVLKEAQAALHQANPGRIVTRDQLYSEVVADWYKTDIAMAWLMVGICVLLLLVTALGIVGLVSFWVQKRTKQIGIRRALGATKSNILRYFQLENLFITSAGIVLGIALTIIVNQLLIQHYEYTRLPFWYIPLAVVVVLVTTQLAVYWPARKAASIPPAIATRSV